MEFKLAVICFNTDEALQDKVKEVLCSTQHYLKWQTSKHGQEHGADWNIPKLDHFCYYGRVITSLGSSESAGVMDAGKPRAPANTRAWSC